MERRKTLGLFSRRSSVTALRSSHSVRLILSNASSVRTSLSTVTYPTLNIKHTSEFYHSGAPWYVMKYSHHLTEVPQLASA